MKYLICNLKANKDYYEMLLYKESIHNLKEPNIELILAPSICYLPIFKGEELSLCAQNISLNEELNLTGDVSISQLLSLNVKYVIVGHYERRKYYNETEHDIIKKISIALKNDLKVIYCIGETYEELSRHVEYQVLERAIARILNNVSTEDFKNIIIAYEPAYMIGGKNTLNINKISENITFIKNLIDNYYHGEIKVVYGGNINPNTIKEFSKIKNLDGLMLGTSSLNPEDLRIVMNNMNK
ncbi:MAG: triose-phosphate isomerase [Ruminococcus sp.]|nr:triose-phosphate isomerase [Ruminococcus sp.]